MRFFSVTPVKPSGFLPKTAALLGRYRSLRLLALLVARTAGRWTIPVRLMPPAYVKPLPSPPIDRLPSSYAHKTQIIKIDIVVVPMTDVPKQNRFAKAVVRRFRGTRARDGAATVIEPVARNVPAWNLGH
jgi:hypothetical protein